MYVGVYVAGEVSSGSSELALLSLPEKLSPSEDEVATRFWATAATLTCSMDLHRT